MFETKLFFALFLPFHKPKISSLKLAINFAQAIAIYHYNKNDDCRFGKIKAYNLVLKLVWCFSILFTFIHFAKQNVFYSRFEINKLSLRFVNRLFARFCPVHIAHAN